MTEVEAGNIKAFGWKKEQIGNPEPIREPDFGICANPDCRHQVIRSPNGSVMHSPHALTTTHRCWIPVREGTFWMCGCVKPEWSN